MKFKTEFRVLKLKDIVPPPYNPREDIAKGSDEYEALRRSLEQHGMVEPPVVNIHNMRCIGGNQRITVLRDMGVEEVLCSIIDQPDEEKEKKLCLSLNRIEGRWDNDALGDLLRDDDVLDYETGFDADEVRLYRQLEDVQEPDVGEQEEPDDLEDLEEEDAEEEPDEEPDADADDVPALGSTLVRVGHLHFKVEVVRYNRTLDGIRDKGIFDRAEIAEELKRRLLHND